MTTPQQPNPAQMPGIILAVCALLLLIGMVTKGWASASEGGADIGAGLFSVEGCGGGRCASFEWDEAEDRLDIPSDVTAFRILGTLGGFAALVGIGAAAGLALTRNPHKIPVKVIQIVIGVAGAALAIFATRLWMADKDVNFGPSYSGFLAFAGLIGAEVILLTKIKPLAAQMPQAQPVAAAGYPPAPGQAPAQMCPRCGQPIEFVAQYQKWFCRNENQYL